MKKSWCTKKPIYRGGKKIFMKKIFFLKFFFKPQDESKFKVLHGSYNFLPSPKKFFFDVVYLGFWLGKS